VNMNVVKVTFPFLPGIALILSVDSITPGGILRRLIAMKIVEDGEAIAFTISPV